jgi:hypothetical protein
MIVQSPRWSEVSISRAAPFNWRSFGMLSVVIGMCHNDYLRSLNVLATSRTTIRYKIFERW